MVSDHQFLVKYMFSTKWSMILTKILKNKRPFFLWRDLRVTNTCWLSSDSCLAKLFHNQPDIGKGFLQPSEDHGFDTTKHGMGGESVFYSASSVPSKKKQALGGEHETAVLSVGLKDWSAGYDEVSWCHQPRGEGLLQILGRITLFVNIISLT